VTGWACPGKPLIAPPGSPTRRERTAPVRGSVRRGWLSGVHADPLIETDLLIEVENKPGALATLAAAISDAGVNISAATCTRPGDTARLHILVKHPEAAKHALATALVTVTSQREVVVVDADDRPGVLADLARVVAAAGVDLDLLYLATKTRIVFGSPDLDGLRRALGASPAG
jgi:hypothetical protein